MPGPDLQRGKVQSSVNCWGIAVQCLVWYSGIVLCLVCCPSRSGFSGVNLSPMDSRARARDDLVQYPITVIPSNNGKGSDDDFLYKRIVFHGNALFWGFSGGLGGWPTNLTAQPICPQSPLAYINWAMCVAKKPYLISKYSWGGWLILACPILRSEFARSRRRCGDAVGSGRHNGIWGEGTGRSGRLIADIADDNHHWCISFTL